MLKLAIITVLYKSNEVLEDFIKSVSGQSYTNYELYLIDNSPSSETDNILEILLQKYPVTKVQHIKNLSNLGAAGGNNVGISAALKDNCDVILMSNTDVKFTDDKDLFSKALNQMLAEHKKIIVPKIYTANKAKIWMAGASLNNLLAKAKHFGYEKLNASKYSKPMYVSYAPSTFMFIDNEVFRKVGLLDEKYFAYFEDADFIFRSNKAGYKIYYSPDINIEHLVSYTTGGALSMFTLYHGVRNRIYFSMKNLPFYKWVVTFPYILVITICRLPSYNSQQRRVVIKGIKDGFKLNTV